MRRFDYYSYLTPDDPKQLRQHTQGKFRTAAATFRGVAEAFAGEDRDSVSGVLNSPLADDPERNQLSFTYRSASPCPCEVYVEMEQVIEGPTHPLTTEGFDAWAQDRVKHHPVFEGKRNTVELELAVRYTKSWSTGWRSLRNTN